MVHVLSFTSLVLGLLFTFFAIRDSTAHTQQAVETTTVANGNGGLAATGRNALSVDQELFLGFQAAATTVRNKRLRGRKMMDNLLMKEVNKEEGKGINASNKSFGTSPKNMNDQNNSKMLKPKTLNSASKEIPGSEPLNLLTTNQLNYQDSRAVSACGNLEYCSSRTKESAFQLESRHDSFRKIESRKLLRAANEIVNLMHKDYNGMSRPRLKPPINNHVPALDKDCVKP